MASETGTVAHQEAEEIHAAAIKEHLPECVNQIQTEYETKKEVQKAQAFRKKDSGPAMTMMVNYQTSEIDEILKWVCKFFMGKNFFYALFCNVDLVLH